MKNTKKVMMAAVAATSLLAGCSSIDKPVGAEPYRPTVFDASYQHGEASYTSSVFAILERGRRADTYKKIHDFCHGKFQTLGESNDGDKTHIAFACLPDVAIKTNYPVQSASPTLY